MEKPLLLDRDFCFDCGSDGVTYHQLRGDVPGNEELGLRLLELGVRVRVNDEQRDHDYDRVNGGDGGMNEGLV
jgi:hypothetical protein